MPRTFPLQEAFSEPPEGGEESISTSIIWRELDEDEELSAVETFDHERTGTRVRIMESDSGDYSIQPSMGGMNADVFVHQPEEPGSLVSGTSAVAALEVPDLPTARCYAYMWAKGWSSSVAFVGVGEGDIKDMGPNYEYEPDQ